MILRRSFRFQRKWRSTIRYHRVYLVAGDAAHKFPPLGGFGFQDILCILTMFFSLIDQPDRLKSGLKHFIDVHCRLGVKAIEFDLTGECVMHAIRTMNLDYAKSTATAQALGIDSAYPETARKILQDTTVLSDFFLSASLDCNPCSYCRSGGPMYMVVYEYKHCRSFLMMAKPCRLTFLTRILVPAIRLDPIDIQEHL
eukprot:gene10897-12108_t